MQMHAIAQTALEIFNPTKAKEKTLKQHNKPQFMATKAFSNQRMRSMGRTVTPLLLTLAVSSIAAHAQGSVDLSGVTTAMTSVQKAVQLGGATALVISLFFAVFQFMGRNIAQGFIGVGGALLAGIVIGFGPGWVASLTGQSVSMLLLHATAVLA